MSLAGLSGGGVNQSANAAIKDKEGLNTTTWYTANGNDTPIISLRSTDGPTMYMHSINIDKYKDLVVHYTVKNETGTTQPVELFLTLPMFNNSQIPASLTFDPSRADQLTVSTKDNTGGGTFNTLYSYEPGAYQLNRDDSKSMLAVLAAPQLGEAGNLLNNASLSVSVPLKLIKDYDFNSSIPSAVPAAGVADQLYYPPLFKDFQSRAIWVKPYKSPLVSDFISANYDSLVGVDKYNGIVKLLKDNTGENSLKYTIPIEEPDHSKATVDAITPTNEPGQYTVTYTYDGVTKSVTATTTDKSYIDAHDFMVNYRSDWKAEQFAGITTLKDSNGNSVTPVSSNVTVTIKDSQGNSVNDVNTNNAGAVYDVTYKSNGASKTIKVTVGQNSPTPTPVVPNNDNHSSTNTTTPTAPTTNSTSGSTTTTKPAIPNNTAKKGAAVYATKKIYLYRQATFKKVQRIATYPKGKRVNRPMFVVTDYARSKGGTLRYKVRDVNHHSKTAGKVGYITANNKYVVPVYYASMPKNKKVTIISKKGVNAYRNVNLTKKVKHYKKGAHLKVKKIVKHNLTSRYVLSNGDYMTGNKKLVIQGNY